MMRALPTQFDRSRRTAAVATPTCCSCCCCCCCAATIATSTSVIAMQVNSAGRTNSAPNRHLLTIIAVLYWPIIAALTYLVIGAASGSGGEVLGWLTPILAFGLLWFLYSRTLMYRPLQHTIIVTAIIYGAFIAELFVGGALILSTMGDSLWDSSGSDPTGALAYLFLAGAVIIGVPLVYRRRLRRMPNYGGEPEPLPQAYPPPGPPSGPPLDPDTVFLPKDARPQRWTEDLR